VFQAVSEVADVLSIVIGQSSLRVLITIGFSSLVSRLFVATVSCRCKFAEWLLAWGIVGAQVVLVILCVCVSKAVFFGSLSWRLRVCAREE